MTAETPPPALRHAPDWVAGRVVPGRGAASGAREYRELGGSLNAQLPHFLARGLDLHRFARATINVDASPLTFAFVDPLLTLRGIDWHPDMPAEDFSFSPCRLRVAGGEHDGLVYYPRPETKAAYAAMPPPSLLEILAPPLDGIAYGVALEVGLDSREIAISRPA